jgi:hypothetical protein
MRSILWLMGLLILLALPACTAVQPARTTPGSPRPTATLHPHFEQRQGDRPGPASGDANDFQPATPGNEAVEASALDTAAPAGTVPAGSTSPASGTDATAAAPLPGLATTSTPSVDEESAGTPAPVAGTPAPVAGGASESNVTGITTRGEGTGAATAEPATANIFSIFSDTVHPDWTLQNSDGIAYRLVDASRAYSGTAALALTPMADFGTLFFTVKPGAGGAYPRRHVERVVFWLYSPDQPLNLDSLAVTIVGSNIYPYWIEGDNSVENDSWPIFSETRLEFLGFNYPIPADTWAEVEIWLDDLLYDPMYEWITGFYIKNDEGFYDTVFIDEVQLIMVAE